MEKNLTLNGKRNIFKMLHEVVKDVYQTVNKI